ncbi:protein-disulfide reductase DsbD family protein [Elioraea rosea]|uniref:protein-disulfide reductase DsbD family protein n=1 Tax=Elioraea rosea TaxID=2492390 RepID=UPI00118259AF|nr:thioredoxin family protein [Elioraea rosea]
MWRLLTALSVLLAPGAAGAVESAPVTSPRATVTVVSSVEAIAPGRPFRIALRQRLAPGWHTYWTNPGDAGAPPEMALALPEGASASDLAFPTPERIPYGPLVNFGYENEVLFLATVTPPAALQPGDRFALEASASWLVCEKICIPEEGVFRLDLPVEGTPRPAAASAEMIRAGEAALPRPSPFAVTVGFEGQGGAIALAGEALAPGSVREAYFFPADWGVLDHAAPQPMTLSDGVLTLSLARGVGPVPASVSGLVSIVDRGGVRSGYVVSAAPGPVPALPAAPGLPLWQAIAFAALGGLILNLMPCVFPILAMKAMGIARLSGAARGEIRAHAAAYTAGVVLSFLALGGLLVALKGAGMAAGWGFQFTSPVFVAALAWLMLAVGLNLSGVYAVSGPMGLGQGAASQGGKVGAFFTGALAVLVATPCTAPFMAAAIGAAVAMPPAATLAVFAALGVGMALPYVILGAAPGLARFLPRPGAWMERLRQGLAFPMYAAAVWLVWVLAQQGGADAVLAVLAGAVLLGFGLWALGQAQGSAGRGRRIGQGLAAAAVIGAVALLPRLDAASPPAGAATASVSILPDAEPWSPERVAALRAEGRPVFVNMTAAWCITCKVNERVALTTDAVQLAFAERNVAVLVGDWTRGDAAITALLRQHQRDGVPLYLYYPAGGGAPAILPQILTEGIVLDAIGAAKGPLVGAARGSTI